MSGEYFLTFAEVSVLSSMIDIGHDMWWHPTSWVLDLRSSISDLLSLFFLRRVEVEF